MVENANSKEGSYVGFFNITIPYAIIKKIT